MGVGLGDGVGARVRVKVGVKVRRASPRASHISVHLGIGLGLGLGMLCTSREPHLGESRAVVDRVALEGDGPEHETPVRVRVGVGRLEVGVSWLA